MGVGLFIFKIMYDICIIGSGSAGYVAGIRGAQLGKKVCIVERDEIGGVCLNRGCIPTKALLASVEAFQNVKNAKDFGIKVTSPEISFQEIMRRKQMIVRKLTSGIRFLLKQNGVEIINGEANIKEPGCLTVGEKEIKAKSIIICTGSSSFLPFEVDREYILTSDEILSLESLPKSILIIGAGVIGVEFATIFSGLGSKVTLVEMLPGILPEIKDEKIVNVIKKELEAQGIKIIEGSKVEKIETSRNISLLSTGEEIEAEKVLIACGRVPNLDTVKNIGLNIEAGRIVVDSSMRTNINGIYAAGDITGTPLLAHKSSSEGIVATENASGLKSVMDYNSIPNCIFSNPEIACVGKFESEVPDAKVGEYRFQGVGKALCIGESKGFAKVITDKNCKVKGVQIIGPHASDLIPICVMGVKNEIMAQELGELIYPHPTLSECLKEAFLDITHSAIHKL